MAYLFLFQIGPVQAFIAQARRTHDLFIGSYILSELASAGVLAASHLPGFSSIYPVLDHGAVKGGAPHRFLFQSDEAPETAAAVVRSAVENRWLTGFADPVGRLVANADLSTGWHDTFRRQSTNWMEFYWAAVPYDSKYHGESYRKVSAAIAQRKYTRTFLAVEEPGDKCTLTGMQSALSVNWKALRNHIHDHDQIVLRSNEKIGTIALIKRLAAYALEAEQMPIPDYKHFLSTSHIAQDNPNASEESLKKKDVAGYLAVLHMDGDQIGKRISQLKDAKQHTDFSNKLAEFASKVPDIIHKYGGKTGTLVYAGGDDVLALLPLSKVLKCAWEISKQFTESTRMPGYDDLTASAGIAITPDDLPLDRALELARDAEEKAKEKYGRNAVVVVEAHGTGQMREAGAKWEIINFVLDMQELFEAHTLSGKLGYDLQVLSHDLPGDDLRPAREAEVKRLIGRRTAEGVSHDQKKKIDTLTNLMIQLVEAKHEHEQTVVPYWSDMANWVILARFLAQGGRRESEMEAQS
ncbi:MAG: type III-B CRISPR-associated protein Cas10/Cmr2 [Anaerolineae bacterium]|nr:type III-B CRISPR-associated protein Cas10/Cmr2 [Anaerolineae bacterium]